MSEAKTRRKSGRKKTAPVNVYECPAKEKWKVNEKQALLEGIKRHGPENPELLQVYVPGRNLNEIEWFVKKIKISKNFVKNVSGVSPMEKWLQLVMELVHHESVDFSKVLSEVMAVVAHGETTCIKGEEGEASEGNQPDPPNYSRMYQYMEALLSGGTPPILSRIEAAIFLELMYGLADRLRTSDLDVVKRMMLWKYDLLTEPVDPTSRNRVKENIRSALENDWSKGNRYGLPTPEDRAGCPPATTTRKIKKRTATRVRPTEGDNVPCASEGENSVRPSSSNECPGSGAAIDSVPQKRTLDEKSKGKKSSKRPCPSYRVVKKISEPASTSKPESLSEKSPIKSEPNSTSTEKSVFPTASVTGPSECGESVMQTEPSSVVKSPAASAVQVAANLTVTDSKAVDTVKESPKVFKKPVLYTLNPLCIPVSLLSLEL